MQDVCREVRRVLTPTGSAVFLMQPDSQAVGSMRSWVFEFLAWICRDWNLIQDVWAWNTSTSPHVHCQQKYGLLRSSVRACVWAGAADCYRDQTAVLWGPSDELAAQRQLNRTGVRGTARADVSPFNLIPLTPSLDDAGRTPASLAQWWIRYLCPAQGMVLDPFLGTGTIGLEAIKLKRRFQGCELRADLMMLAQQRMMTHTAGSTADV
jgi:hypothetical protein